MNKPDLNFISSAEELAIQLVLAGLLFYVLEKKRPAEPQTRFFKDDFKNELAIALMNGAFFVPLYVFAIAYILLHAVQDLIPYQIFDQQITALPYLVQMVLGALMVDFSTYWRHRFAHVFMWRFHSLHHSARQITWLTALRLHPLEVLVATLLDTLMLHIFGFMGPGILLAILFVQIYNYFLHANIDIVYPKPWRYILASPHYHRWHHANDRRAYDKNFCGIFSVLDVIFGTYHHPEELPETYGLSPSQSKEWPASLGGQLLYPFRRGKRRRGNSPL